MVIKYNYFLINHFKLTSSRPSTLQGPDFRTFMRWRISIKFDFTTTGDCIIVSVFCFKNGENIEKIERKLFSNLISFRKHKHVKSMILNP